MAVFKCKMCGGNLDIQEGMSVCECEYCGSMQTVPNVDDEKKLSLFTRANRLRAVCEFDKAYGVYESIVSEFPEEAEAYWGLVLCKYGIEYVDDPQTGKKIPTCHRSSFDSVLEDSDFEMVMEYADAIARPVYRNEAKAIEGLRAKIIEVSANEESYDIFICYKETGANGERTIDSVLAQDVYDALADKGYKVFFSRISLEDKLGVEYEPYIFSALNSAKVMLAFGTDYEYYNAVWVKNEWSRFLSLIEKGEKKILIPCYKGIDAYDMPAEFKRLQAQDFGKVGALQDLLRGIDKIFEKKTVVETKIVSMESAASPHNALTKRGFLYLEDKDYDKADEYFDKALDENPENGDAYLGKVFAKLHIQNLDQLGELSGFLTLLPDFEKAVRFSEGEQKNRLSSIWEKSRSQDGNNQHLIDRIHQGGLIYLAPILRAAAASVISEKFGVSETTINEILAEYEVYSVFEKSSEPMDIQDLRNASEFIEKLDIKVLRKILVDLNHSGFISFNNRKFSFLSDAYRKSQNEEYKKRLQREISAVEEKITALKQKIDDLPSEIEAAKSRLAGNDGLEEAEQRAEQERRLLSENMEAHNRQKEELLNQIKGLEAELSETGLFKLIRKAELNHQIGGVRNSISVIDAQMKQLSDMIAGIKGAEGVIAEREKAVGMLENELTASRSLIGELEKERDKLRAEGDNCEWKPEPIDIYFEYDFVMSVYNKEVIGTTTKIDCRILKGTERYNGKADIIGSDGSVKGRFLDYYIEQVFENGSSQRLPLQGPTVGDGVRLNVNSDEEILKSISVGDWVVRMQQTDVETALDDETTLNEYIGKNFDPANKVKAIKYYREKTGLGLKEARDAVELIFDQSRGNA